MSQLMFDTVALSETSFRQPDPALLGNPGVTAKLGQRGQPYEIVFSPPKGTGEPRIVMSRRFDGAWVTRPEVSIGRWLFGSNLHLPTAEDIPDFLDRIGSYVSTKTELPFDAPNARVARLDITKDLRLDENVVLDVIDNYRHFKKPKYNTSLINSTTINFDNQGKVFWKRYTLYSKYHERLAQDGSPDELEMAKGLLRFEIQHRTNKSVRYLAESNGLPSHQAKYVLNPDIAEKVGNKALLELNVNAAITIGMSGMVNLFERYGHATATKITSHFAVARQYGPTYFDNPVFGTSAKTANKYTRMAIQVGVFSL
jgi:hypothetical protein